MRARFAHRIFGMLVLVTTASPALAQEARKIPAELQGHWKLLILGFEGREIKVRDNMPYWIIKADRVLYGGEPLASLIVDTTTTPPIIDVHYTDSKRVFEAVYAVEGDRLKICVNQRTQGVKERPLDFATKGHSERRLFIFQRQDETGGDGSANAPGDVGVDFDVKTKEKTKEKTVFIAAVAPQGPAQKAGLKKDDVITRIGEFVPTTLREAYDQVRQARAGSELTVRIRRGDKEQDIRVPVRVEPFYFLDD
jgi:uncharacterized protein (TIGR03067 family)